MIAAWSHFPTFIFHPKCHWSKKTNETKTKRRKQKIFRKVNICKTGFSCLRTAKTNKITLVHVVNVTVTFKKYKCPL